MPNLIHALVQTIVTLIFLIGPFVWWKIASKKEKERKMVDTNDEVDSLNSKRKLLESDDAYVLDESSYKRSLFNIFYYIASFFIFVVFLSSILVSVYIKKNGINPDVINVQSELFDQVIYDKMDTTLSPLLNIITYLVAFVGVFACSYKVLIEDFKKINKRYIGLAFIGLALIYAANLVSNLILLCCGVDTGSSNQEQITKMFNADTVSLVIMLIVTVFFAPIVEELIFRKSIFNLCKGDKRLGLIVSSLCFGFLHVISFALTTFKAMCTGDATYLDFISEVISFIPYSMMGAALGYVYIKSERNVGVSILTHFLNNAVSTIVLLLTRYLESIGISI